VLEAGRPPGAAQFAGVLLHGRGGTPDAVIDLAARLGLDGGRWLAPAADGGSWYPNRFMEPVASNEPSLSRAIERCDAVVRDAAERGRLSAGRIAVIGFSQGACLAVEYAVRHPGRCGALVVFTGGLIGPAGTDGSLPREPWWGCACSSPAATSMNGCLRRAFGKPRRCSRRKEPTCNSGCTPVARMS